MPYCAATSRAFSGLPLTSATGRAERHSAKAGSTSSSAMRPRATMAKPVRSPGGSGCGGAPPGGSTGDRQFGNSTLPSVTPPASIGDGGG